MTNAKRLLSAAMALVMVLTMFSCLGVVAGARYEHGNGTYANWNKTFDPNEVYGIKSYQTLSANGTFAERETKSWYYIGIEVYEADPDGSLELDDGSTWSLTDHYLQPGQALYIRYYLKTNCAAANFMLHTQFSRRFFDLNAFTDATPSYDSSKSPDDGLNNSGYATNKYFGDTWEGDKNPLNVMGTANGGGIKISSNPVATVSAVYSGKLEVPQDLINSWDITAVQYSTPTGCKTYLLDSDEYLFGYKIKVREANELYNNEPAVYNGAVGYLGVDEGTTRLKHNNAYTYFNLGVQNNAAANTATSFQLAPTSTSKRPAITYATFDTEDANHTFIIGTPGSNPPATNYTAKFFDGSTELTDLQQTGNGNITLPAAPTAPAGKVFGGWSDGSSTYAAGATYNLTANTNFTAVWDDETYDVRFYDGATEYGNLAQTGVTYNSSITLPAAPTKQGFRFDGWMLGQTKYNANASYTVTADTDFTAAWKQLYTATFVDDSTGASLAQAAEYAAGDTVTFPAVTERDGYTWAWSPNVSTMPAADTEFRLVWTASQSGITFVSNGGSEVAAATGSYGDPVVYAGNPTKTGYTFAGWYTDNGTFENEFTVPDTLPASAVIVYAKWTPNLYDAYFYVVEGQERTLVATVTDVTFGTSFTAPEKPSEEGYSFSNWAPAAGYNSGFVMDAEGKDYESIKTVNQYTVTYKNKDGGTIRTDTLDYGSAISFPAAPQVTGQTFTGWTGDDNSFVGDGGSATVPAYNIVYTATYGTSSHDVNYYVDGVLWQTGSAFYGSGISAPTYDPGNGKTWSGWTDLPALMPDNDIDVHSTTAWINYTVTYLNADGSTFAQYTGKHYGDAVPVPVDEPVLAGSHFQEWDCDETTVTGNLTIEPVFAPNLYPVTFVYGLNGEEDLVDGYATYNQIIALTDFPNDDAAVSGYSFKWYYGYVDENNPGTEVTSAGFTVPALDNGDEIVFTAVYEASGYTIEYYVGTSRRHTDSYQFGAPVTIWEVEPETGYDFSAWVFTNAATGATVTEPVTMPDYNIKATTTRSAHMYHDVWLDVDGTTLYEADVAYGAAIPSQTLPVHAGMDVRWNNNLINQPAEDLTIRAIASGSEVGYSITVKTEKLDGSFAEATDTSFVGITGDTVTVPNSMKTKTGYHVDETNSVLSATLAGDGSTNLIAILLLNDRKIFVNDAAAQQREIDIKYSATVTDPAPTEKTGYSFVKWNWAREDANNPGQAGQTINSKPATMPNYNLVATAEYSVNKYAFNTYVDGQLNTTTEITFGTAIAEPAALSQTGYTFDGWYSDPECQTLFDFTQTMPAQAVNVYAQFVINQYTYTLDLDGGTISGLSDDWTESGASYSITADYGTAITVPAPEKTGFTFQAWSPAIPATIGAENKVFTAVYTRNNYKVTYVSDGSTVKEINAPYEAVLAELAAPTVTKLGNTFDKWEYTFDGAAYDGTTVPAGPVTATAKWNINKYDAVFYANSGDAQAFYTESQVPFGSSFNAPAGPADTEFYNFGGWSDGNAVYQAGDSITMDAEGKVFNAVWTQNTAACRVDSVARITDDTDPFYAGPYYQLGYSNYKVVFKPGVSPDALVIDQGDGQLYWFTKIDLACGNAPDLLDISTVGENEVWTIRLVLAETAGNTYLAYCEVDGQLEETENALRFGVTYDVKDNDTKLEDIKSISISDDKVVKGEYLTWTVTTSDQVMWLEFLGNWDDADYKTYYKYTTVRDNPTENVTVTEDAQAGTITWSISMRFTYAGTADKKVENFKVLYKIKNSSVWENAPAAAGGDYSIDITVGKKAEVLQPAVQGYDQYTLVSVTPKAANAAIGEKDKTFTIVTTKDVSKVRITYVNASTGKSKAATFQTTSSAIDSVTTDDATGLTTWVINFKFAAPAQNNEFSVDCRGLSWGEAQTVTVVVA